jgi:hypothetical protein
MALSDDLLALVDALDRAELDVQYLLDVLDDIIADKPSGKASEEQNDEESTLIEIQQLVRLVVQAKQEASFKIAPSLIEMLREVIDGRHLDRYFTIQALTSIPGVTTRWTKLANLGFAKSPGDKVARYIQQAVGCYLYGMYDAAASLCRSVLEFSLRERLGSTGVLAAEARTELERLIDFCARSRVLTPDGQLKSHLIRRRGNGSIHGEGCDEPSALLQLLDTREVLVQVYGQTQG